MAKHYHYYDASTTLAQIKEVLIEHEDYKEELTTELEQIEKKMMEVSELPLIPAGELYPSCKFAIKVQCQYTTNRRTVRKTEITAVTIALEKKFTDACIGYYMRELTRTDTGPFWAICEIGKGKTSERNEKLRKKKHEDILRLFNLIHYEIKRFQESVSGWILEQNIETLRYGLKCDENEKVKWRHQNELLEAWKRKECAMVVVSGLEKMFQRMRKAVGCEDED
ncbi:hypothetical protein J4E93_005318 [Alternaria ventricosa]|uniref:uncharacterized protein n=1 Tax=Alternaria ventricosa TaxID=1187951 RepID=UPI0020C26A84|nr:uncharacterized protein J4E93_005318 [Alternaria ventricosa]KAI4645740.1 hypothetical protein J4E93_005318 [Alternaria ventricosa]